MVNGKGFSMDLERLLSGAPSKSTETAFVPVAAGWREGNADEKLHL
jgi:hypothetical protein